MFEFEYIRKQYYKLGSLIKKKEIPLKNIYLEKKGSFNKRRYDLGTHFGNKNEYYTLTGAMEVPNIEDDDFFIIEVYSSLTEWDNSTNPQIKLYLNEDLIQGLDVNHRECFIDEKYFNKKLSVTLEIFSGREEKTFPIYVKGFVCDKRTFKTYWDLRVATEAWQALDSEYERQLCESVLLKCVNELDFRNNYSFEYYKKLEWIQETLNNELYKKHKNLSKSEVYAIGHTHIDLAWLWTFKQAIEKAERSFSTMLKFMEQYPDFTFIQSQPQLYEFIKNDYPILYNKILKKIKENQWFPEGAMWVESDTNLISGESMVRQFLYGKKFFKKEFNVDSKIVWLPDVFGYSAALPQIMKKTNTPYFMTTKLSWNQMNQIPNDSFIWKGLDGSEVLVHMIPTISVGYSPTPHYTTYNGMLDPLTLKKSWDRYLNKDKNNYIMNAYGYGDGGGGPTIEMLETSKRLKEGLFEIPKIRNTNPIDFFLRLEKDNEFNSFNKWTGELYFEYHRGTYTSISKIKNNNRKIEFALQNLEKIYSIYNFDDYPVEKIEELWKKVLKLQFHDVLPGSSIKEVYDEADIEYQVIFEQIVNLKKLIEKNKATENKKIIFNPNGTSSSNYLKLPYVNREISINGKKIPTQQLKINNEVMCYIEKIPPLSSIEIILGDIITKKVEEKDNFIFDQKLKFLDTPIYRVKFDDKYNISSLFHKKSKREIVNEEGFLNELVVYEDIPMDYDAWDIDIYYKNKRWKIDELVDVKVLEDGPLIFVIERSFKYQSSEINQQLIFYDKNERIDFMTTVNWQEKQQLLRAEFDVDIHTFESIHDIQFGNIKRSVHENTSWDIAKFETCAHKWIDLSEGNFGCALLTDSKYGYNTGYKKMGVSLIKSPIDPYPEADNGLHNFTYSFYPHEQHWRDSDVINESYHLNNPPLILNLNEIKNNPIMFKSISVIIETIKKAENSLGIIIRLYESKGRRESISCKIDKKYKNVEICNLLEEKIENCKIINGNIDLLIKPYEIVTLRLY